MAPTQPETCLAKSLRAATRESGAEKVAETLTLLLDHHCAQIGLEVDVMRAITRVAIGCCASAAFSGLTGLLCSRFGRACALSSREESHQYAVPQGQGHGHRIAGPRRPE